MQEEERKRLEEVKKEEERKQRAKSRFTEIKEVSTISKPDIIPESEEIKEEVVPKQEYYTPQNVPTGSFPLRIPNQIEVGKLLTSKLLVNLPPPPPPQPKPVQADVVMQPERTVAPVFNEAANEETSQTHALKTESAVLNERLDELEQKRKVNEAREQAQQKQAKLEDFTEEDQKVILEKVKQIYYSLPKDKDKILEYPLNWDVLYELNVIDGVMHRIVSKRVKKILHVEEPGLIS